MHHGPCNPRDLKGVQHLKEAQRVERLHITFEVSLTICISQMGEARETSFGSHELLGFKLLGYHSFQTGHFVLLGPLGTNSAPPITPTVVKL